MPSLQIQPQYLTLGQFLSNRLFRIPDYQRAYSWMDKQRTDLFGDIRKTNGKGPEAEHFMATVVALRRNPMLIGTDKHYITEIVDGQQRLTTLIMLLKAIERSLDRSDRSQEKDADELSQLLVKPDTESLLLLQTNHDTSHYFSKYLREGTHPDVAEAKTTADRHLLTAMVECEQFAREWQAAHGLPSLLALLKNRLTFVVHEIGDESAVYSVFEVLNSRGLVVPWFDRLKSILMEAAFELKSGNKEIITELHNIWRDIYACIGLRLGMSNEALRFAATLKAKQCPNRLVGEQDSVTNFQGEATTAKKILSTAHWLLTVTKACDNVQENPRLGAVTRIAQARLLAAAINLRADLPSVHRTELLRLWENVTFRIFGMFDYDARTAVGEYVRLAWQVIHDKPDYKQIIAALKQLGSDYPITDAVEELINTDCYSDWQENLRYLLFRYEEHLAKEKGQSFDNEQWERIWMSSPSDTIEHIWPQSKAPAKQMHRLGNLLLLPPQLNSKLGARAPKKKTQDYRDTGLLIAQQVANSLSKPWNNAAIDKRERMLLKWARQQWAD